MSFQVPQKFRAFTADEKAKGSVKEVSTPALGENDVLVKVSYAAQNPTDWKHLSFFSPKGAIIGGDVAGTVVAVGSNIRAPLKVGDKVAGIVHGNLYTEQGTFAEYTRAQSDVLFKIPEGLSEADASTFGVAWYTALQALVQSQGAQWPPAKVEGEPWYLVYGGSTSVGLFALQVARILGYKPITVASPRNFDLVKSYGAEHVVDYSDPEKTIEEIKRVTGGGVKIGLDTISEGKSFEIAAKSFAPGGGRSNAILWPTDEQKAVRKDVEIVTTLMYTLFGHSFTTFGKHYEVIPEDYQFGQEAAARTPDLITKYNIKANPIDLRGGLDAVQEGLDFQKAGKVSAKKSVYKIAQ